MRAQIDRRIVLINPPRQLQTAKEVAHAAYIIARPGQCLKPQAIRLPFKITAESQLRLNRTRLGRGNRSTGHLRIRTGSEHADGHCSHHRDRALLLPDNLTRKVVLCDMRDLVRKNSGQLGLRLGGEQRPTVHADESTEHRKRVDGVISDKKEVAIGSRTGTSCDQTTAQSIQIVGDLGVVNVAWLSQADLVENPLADFPFELRRELGTRRLAEVWKVIGQDWRRTAK